MTRAYYSDSPDAIYKRKRRAENTSYGQRPHIAQNVARTPALPKSTIPSAGEKATAALLLISASALVFVLWVWPALTEYGLIKEENERK